MKHYHIAAGYRSRHSAASLIVLLFCSLTLSVLSSCSSDAPAAEADVEEIAAGQRLVIETIDELESVTVGQIPGTACYEGWHLEELSYECVDTIEMRALLMDARARFTSPAGDRSVEVSFEAEVGPRLVSVEYEPFAEVIPAHHNLSTGQYPGVYRYRNYSDGSRVGPDIFRDYGHPIQISAVATGRSFGEIDYKTVAGSEGLNGQFYRGGRFYDVDESTISSYNINAIAYDRNGRMYSGNDIFPDVFGYDYGKALVDAGNKEYSLMRDNFYDYDPSRLYNMDDDTTRTALTMCKDVPIAPGATQFQKDNRNLQPGYYYREGIWHNDKKIVGFRSEFSKLNWDNAIAAGLYYQAILYSQYLIIDGRLIHFNFENLFDFKVLSDEVSVTKTNDAVIVNKQLDVSFYGEFFTNLSTLTVHKTSGPEEIIYDDRDSNEIERNDAEELENARNKAGSRSGDSGLLPLPDGGGIVIDRSLPASVRDITRSRTIKSCRL